MNVKAPVKYLASATPRQCGGGAPQGIVVQREFMLEVATVNVMVTAEYVSVATFDRAEADAAIDKRGRIDRSS
jgi:hypothetical protein